MTFKDKVTMEYPECVKPCYTGGVKGCPCNYNYEPDGSGVCGDALYPNEDECVACWDREMEETSMKEEQSNTSGPHILDSGERRQFETGAVRDIQEGKGRCDLMPLEVVADLLPAYDYDKDGKLTHGPDPVMTYIKAFMKEHDTKSLLKAINYFAIFAYDKSCATMLLEVAKHFEEGAKK